MLVFALEAMKGIPFPSLQDKGVHQWTTTQGVQVDNRPLICGRQCLQTAKLDYTVLLLWQAA